MGSFDYLCDPGPNQKNLIIHMPSVFHETMAGQFSDMIVQWYGTIKKGELTGMADDTKEDTMLAAGGIRSTLASKVKIKDKENHAYCGMEPDLSYRHEVCVVSDLLVEVAWSQRSLELPRRAKQYIESMGGEIRTVIGFNMNDIYQGGHGATFSIWRAEYIDKSWRSITVADNTVRDVPDLRRIYVGQSRC